MAEEHVEQDVDCFSTRHACCLIPSGKAMDNNTCCNNFWSSYYVDSQAGFIGKFAFDHRPNAAEKTMWKWSLRVGFDRIKWIISCPGVLSPSHFHSQCLCWTRRNLPSRPSRPFNSCGLTKTVGLSLWLNSGEDMKAITSCGSDRTGWILETFRAISSWFQITERRIIESRFDIAEFLTVVVFLLPLLSWFEIPATFWRSCMRWSLNCRLSQK